MDLKRNAYNQLLTWKQSRNRGTLEVSGARQVGKTYLVNKFADQEYKRKVYVNLLEMNGELFLEHYRQIFQEMKEGNVYKNPVMELMKRYSPEFEDAEDTVVIVDEIQESAEIYNRIREFTRNLKSDFIITGSYLGRIVNKKFKYSAGDMTFVEIRTLNFEEFLQAAGVYRLFEELDIYGKSDASLYDQLSGWYKIYCQIGGYPAVVLRYLEEEDIAKCQDELLRIIKLFTNESRRYFEDILDYEAYDNMFCSIARVLVKEKKGLQEDSFSEKLQQIGCVASDIEGVVNENFVYLELRHRMSYTRELALEMPAFATYGNGELDFFTKSLKSGKTYGIEVKTGKNSGKTAMDTLENQKVDILVMAKGNTHGGIAGNIYTIPIYGISKLVF